MLYRLAIRKRIAFSNPLSICTVSRYSNKELGIKLAALKKRGTRLFEVMMLSEPSPCIGPP
jgi:hypothetical protein